jgi:hypothetical protein
MKSVYASILDCNSRNSFSSSDSTIVVVVVFVGATGNVCKLLSMSL